jgi:hypothetical protein
MEFRKKGQSVRICRKNPRGIERPPLYTHLSQHTAVCFQFPARDEFAFHFPLDTPAFYVIACISRHLRVYVDSHRVELSRIADFSATLADADIVNPGPFVREADAITLYGRIVEGGKDLTVWPAGNEEAEDHSSAGAEPMSLDFSEHDDAEVEADAGDDMVLFDEDECEDEDAMVPRNEKKRGRE